MPGERTSVNLAADLAAAVKASGTPLTELIRRGLAHGTPPGEQRAINTPFTPAAAIAITGDGEPCPGTVCSGPGCWNRDTARYGLRRLVLCAACAAALQGGTYQRKPPPSAARLARRGAA